MGFHAPQEAARVLGEAIDYARQGQIAVLGGTLRARPGAASVAEPTAIGSATAAPPSPLPPGSSGK
jgi:hypothetical protein